MRDGSVLQAEGKEHGTPVTIGQAVPGTVACVTMADIGLRSFIPYRFKIIFALGVPHLGLHYGKKVIGPVSREHKVFKGALPDGGTFQVHGRVGNRRGIRIFRGLDGLCHSQRRNKHGISCAATGTGVNHGSLRGFRGLCHNSSVIPGMTKGFSEVPGLHIAADGADVSSITRVRASRLHHVLCRNILMLMRFLGVSRRFSHAEKHGKREEQGDAPGEEKI